MLSVTVRQLEYAVAIAEFGGVSAAAATLHVSQPALSVAIARLEGQLGKPIFIRRKGSPFVPTSYGRSFLKEARQLLGNAKRLIDPASAVVAQSGPVLIGCYEDLAPLVLAPMLAVFQDRRPEVSVSTRVGGFDMLSEGMQNGQIDFAVTYDLGLDEMFERREIAALKPHAIVGKTHRLADMKSVSLAELAGEALVLADQGLSIRHMIDLFRQRGVTPHVAHRAATLEIMRSLAGNGFGVGISYTRPRSEYSYDGKALVTLDISDSIAAEPVIIATNMSNPPSHSANLLIGDVASLTGMV
jgi:DNA-binding transcriptional LysR family regulator